MPSNARVFVVHVWTEAGAFRARVRAADAEQVCEFVDPQQLLAHLRGQAVTQVEPGALPSPSPTPRTSR